MSEVRRDIVFMTAYACRKTPSPGTAIITSHIKNSQFNCSPWWIRCNLRTRYQMNNLTEPTQSLHSPQCGSMFIYYSTLLNSLLVFADNVFIPTLWKQHCSLLCNVEISRSLLISAYIAHWRSHWSNSKWIYLAKDSGPPSLTVCV